VPGQCARFAFCFSLGFWCFSLSCSSETNVATGGVELKESFGKNGESCGHGLAVIMTDYASTNVALLDLAGETLSGSFISSGSTETRLNAPLSGDVVFPSGRMDEITLIDRYPASVVTWVDPRTSEVRGQLDVRTGFNANPQDFLELSTTAALVSRYETNPRPGRERFDGGDDLLIVNPQTFEITGRVDLESLREGDGLVRPGSLTWLDNFVLVTLSGFEADFDEAGDARLGIFEASSFALANVLEVSGLKNCGAVAVSPNARRLAVICSGLIDSANDARPEHSGVVIYSRGAGDTVLDFKEEKRFLASEFALGPFAFSVAFATSDLVLVTTYGALDGQDAGRPDRVISFDLVSDKSDTLLFSQQEAFNLGDIRCIAPCEVCFIADASRGVVHRFPVIDSSLGPRTEHVVDVDLSLPPRQLGWF
jgi:hypothetical protein